MQHFNTRSVAYGLTPDAFEHLSARDQRRLLTLLARVSEASFRRGYQHGAECADWRRIAPYDLRYKRSLAKAPRPDNPTNAPPVEKSLLVQFPVLYDVLPRAC